MGGDWKSRGHTYFDELLSHLLLCVKKKFEEKNNIDLDE